MRALFKLIPANEWRAMGAVACVAMLLDYTGIALLYPVVKAVATPDPVAHGGWIAALYRASGFTEQPTFAIALCITFMLAFTVKNGLSACLHHRIATIQGRVQHALSERLCGLMLRARNQVFLERRPLAVMSSLYLYALQATNNMYNVVAIFAEGLLIALFAVIMLWLNLKLTLLVLAVFAANAVIVKVLVLDRIQRLGRQRVAEQADYSRLNFGMLHALRDIKAMSLEDPVLADFSRLARRFADTSIRHSTYKALPRLISEVMFVGVGVLAIAAAVVLHLDLQVYMVLLTVFIVMTLRLVPSLQRIYHAVSEIRFFAEGVQGLLDMQTLFAANQLELEPAAKHDAASPPASSPAADSLGPLRFADLRYRYPGAHRDALAGITVDLPTRQFVGLVGRSGSGKSTFLDLVAGLLKADAGSVTLGGTTVDPYHGNAIRRHLGYVPQSVTLLDRSIGYNIAFEPNVNITGEPHRAALVAAARAAQIHDVIAALPDGYATSVGERGLNLSGGQRQRLGIARALYRQPTILLLDEATSSLDYETEREFMDVVTALRDRCTVVFATHRLATVERCDCIYVFDEGRIVGQGTHAELLATCPAYRALRAAPDNDAAPDESSASVMPASASDIGALANDGLADD